MRGALHRLAGPRARLLVCLCAASAVLLLAPPALAAPPAPTASFTATPNPIEPGQTVSFDAAASSSPTGTITRYEWDLDGNGSFETDTGSTPTTSKSYADAGTVAVGLRVTDDQGNTGVATVNVTVNAPPVPSFVFQPETPVRGEAVTFVSTSQDPDGRIASYAWDLDNDGQFNDGNGQVATYTFPTAGVKTVRLRVVDNLGSARIATGTVTVRNQAPSASFSWSPTFPLPGQSVTFQSTSTPPATASLSSQQWDLDGDGAFDDGTGATVTTSFPTPGPKTVSLRVTDSDGGVDIAQATVTVNAPPSASFEFFPAAPVAGDLVQFTSLATDPDGPLVRQEWDLDNDGQFDDATGPVASQGFASAGARTIGLRVVDAHGATATAFSSVDVRPRPVPPAQPRPPVQFISPFPVVRLAGIVTGSGVRVRILSVRAPRKARILVRCRGRGCPVRTQRARGRSRGGVRFRRFERSFRAGSRIEVLVTQSGRIGKYTRFQIRRHRPPARLDLCVGPRSSKPRSCPSR
jgi:YD repeat-containing protein